MTVLKKKETSKLTEAFFEERPTKLEIPNSNLGGDMDGMGDLDNAPMPPMGADGMGMDDSMGGPDDMGGAPDDMGGGSPMGDEPDDMGGAPDDMGGEPPMDGGEDDELMDIINNLSIEDKAAVTKYAKSMADDSEGDEIPQDDGGMPMESLKNIKNVINEVINDILDNQEGTKRPEKKLPKEYINKEDGRHIETPFMTPQFFK